MELTIGDDLMELHASAKPLVNKGCSISVERERAQPCSRTGRTIRSRLTSWISGNPYDFSSFNDRAFVFADRAAAEAFISRHRETFDKYRRVHIIEWPS